ncbi:glycosyltransferase [Azospirillum cavernae]|uniref:glycosyltransferase n=1 Tax=Azospirillum cavernae TaxID=2320860 RepID=UPI0011C3BB13|nr:glycosyltransferase [Azospirillum cavernae]
MALCCILVNDRFLPISAAVPFPYGVTQHVIGCKNAIRLMGHSVALIRYRRDEDALTPNITEANWDDSIGYRFCFNYSMSRKLVIDRMAEAIRLLQAAYPFEDLIYIYTQTPTLSMFIPDGIPIIVTNHGPFVCDVELRIGADAARKAFNWEHEKFDHLKQVQSEGLEWIRRNHRSYCAEISPLQLAYVRGSGFEKNRIGRLPPPLERNTIIPRSELNHLQSQILDRCKTKKKIALTVVSRLDYFKRVELFVDGACEALRDKVIDFAIIIGGEDVDCERHTLKTRVPNEMRESVYFVPRQANNWINNNLYVSLLCNSVFVCTSRFDLVPYTILEAARAGILVLACNSKNVGAVEWLFDCQLFEETPEGISERLNWAFSSTDAAEIRYESSSRLREATSWKAFGSAFQVAVDAIYRD